MRILLINQVFYPSAQSTGQHLSCIAEELVKRGHKVTVLTCRRADDDPSKIYPAQETWRGIEIIRVWKSHLGRKAKWRRGVDFISFFVTSSLRALFLKRYDIVMTLTTPPLISALGAALSRLWRARFYYWVMDLFPDEAVAVGWIRENALPTRIMEAVSRWSLRSATGVIALDHFMGDRLVKKGVAAERVHVIPIWMHDEVRYDPAGREKFRAEHQLEDKYVVMYSGNHSPVHPLETLIEAAKLLQKEAKIHFCFVGGGTEWRKFKTQAQTENWTNATFIGYQPFDELSGSLSAADTQVVVMGDPLVGIIHPCKVYNFLATYRPFVYIGPEKSHIADLITNLRLEHVSHSFRHGESEALADEIWKRANALPADRELWPSPAQLEPWSENTVVTRIVNLMVSK